MLPYRTGIVGIGGRNRSAAVAHTCAYLLDPRMQLACICDLDASHFDDFPSVFGPISTYTDLAAMLDIISICTGDHQHCEVVGTACGPG